MIRNAQEDRLWLESELDKLWMTTNTEASVSPSHNGRYFVNSAGDRPATIASIEPTQPELCTQFDGLHVEVAAGEIQQCKTNAALSVTSRLERVPDKRGGLGQIFEPVSKASIYGQLNEAAQEIRILVLHGSDGATDIVQCDLEVVSLLSEAKPEYEAISYCWAEVSGTDCLIVNGGLVGDIPASAVKVLKQYRLQSVSRRVWIDAICIHQDDYNERSQQVRIMGQIYKNSAKALIWLGDSGGAAIEPISTIGEVLYPAAFHTYCGDEKGNPKICDTEIESMPPICWKDIMYFFSLPWFHRLWVVQEAALAPQSNCRVGIKEFAKETDWLNVTRTARWLTKCGGRLPVPVDPDATNGLWVAGVGWVISRRREEMPVSEMMFFNQRLCCSDERDKFYGFHSMTQLSGWSVDDLQDYGLEIDYRRPQWDVFRDATRFAILESGNLEFLYHVEHPMAWKIFHKLPIPSAQHVSWVPAWSTDPHGNITLPETQNRSDTSPKVDRDLLLADLRRNRLRLRGLELDKIYEFFEDCRNFMEGKNELGRPYSPRDLLIAMVGGTKTFDPDSWLDVETCVNFWTFVSMYSFVKEAWELTYDELRDRCEAKPAADAMRSATQVVLIFKQVVRQCWNRQLFATENGKIGLGPKGVFGGETVAAMFGAELPFILRKAERVEPGQAMRSRGAEFRMIGAGFIPGINADEEIAKLKKRNGRTTVFDIW